MSIPTIEQIKEQCREAIRLGKEEKSAPWEVTGVDEYHQAGYSYVKIRGSQVGQKWQIADVRFCHGPREKKEAESIAECVCKFSAFSPSAARALLALISYMEEECPIDLPHERLNEICKNWTP